MTLCLFTGGMFALGAQHAKDKERYMKIAEDITHTCHEAYDRSGEFISSVTKIKTYL